MLALKGFKRFSNVHVCLFILAAFFVAGFSTHAQANPKYASFVMDADTGLILHQRYANKKLHPASLTKVMTLIMMFDALESGRLRMSDRIYISNHAASMVPSKLDLRTGSSIRVRDAIPALIIKSANDVAVAVAEHLGGSETNFARMMTRRARELGMNSTNFRNASGLHHRSQISTARDMAKMAHYLINYYPTYYDNYFSQKTFRYSGKTYRSHNRLMSSYNGMDGLKTGYIRASGFNLISSATRNNRRIIGVVFGGRTSKSRNRHMALLLNRGFKKMSTIRVASKIIPKPADKPAALQVASAIAPQLIEPAAGTQSVSAISVMPPKPVKWAALNTQSISKPSTKPELLQMAAFEQGSGEHAIRNNEASWAIQVGAFKSEAQTMNAIKKALSKLPRYYTKGEPLIVPLQTASSQLYRARLKGYTSHDAFAACAYIPDCITIAP